MEEELGVALVQRTTRRVSLTDAGILFLDYVRPAVNTLSDGVEAVRSQSGIVRGRIRIGILQSLSPYIDLPMVLGRFHAKYPDVDFAVRSVDSPQAPEIIRAGHLDLSFHALTTTKPAAGVEATPFANDSLVAVCADTHPLAQRETVTLETLSEFPFVDLSPERALRTLVDRTFADRHLARKSIFEVSAVDTMLQFVAGGLGVSIVPLALAKAGATPSRLHILPIRAHNFRMPTWKLVILTRSQRHKLAGKSIQVLVLETLTEATKYSNRDNSKRKHA